MVVGVRSYKPVIDNGRCNVCLVCVRGCPAEIIPAQRKEGTSQRGRVYQEYYKEIEPAPLVNIDKSFDWPPCQRACPIHQDIRGYVNLIGDKKYREALDLIRETNALPSVTGYVCTHPCEGECIRCGVDEPVSLKALKRFVADFDDGRLTPLKASREKGGKVSIIGSGPCGLTAAYDLAKEGYQVDIIEALSEPGGMLRWAIPLFRLPRYILDRDIKYIEKMGVTIKTGVRFGVDVTLSDLRKNGTDAVIIAIGTHQSLKVGIENEGNISGYIDSLTFLRKYASGEQIDLGDKTVVIGGGNVGIDSARSALRCGIKEVRIIDILSEEEVAADKDERKEAQAEGVKFNYLTMPVRIIEKDESQALECVKTKLGEPDESGRRRPVPIKGSEFVVSASSIISAIGQQPDLSWNQENLPFKFSPKNTFVVDDDCSTNIEGVFAAGDTVTGPTVIVEAMASGKRAAKAVDVYLLRKERKS